MKSLLNHDLMLMFSILCYMCVCRINKHPHVRVNPLFHRYLFTIIKRDKRTNRNKNKLCCWNREKENRRYIYSSWLIWCKILMTSIKYLPQYSADSTYSTITVVSLCFVIHHWVFLQPSVSIISTKKKREREILPFW